MIVVENVENRRIHNRPVQLGLSVPGIFSGCVRRPTNITSSVSVAVVGRGLLPILEYFCHVHSFQWFCHYEPCT